MIKDKYVNFYLKNRVKQKAADHHDLPPSELRKERVLLELNNELENGTITIEQFNELREELFNIESIEKNKISDLNLDNVEKLIKMKKKLND